MRLACITVPNFRIALERARAPELRGQPLAIIDAGPGGSNAVLDCSPEASALGVRAGMSVRDARTIAPDLMALTADPLHYDRASQALLDAVESVEPGAEPGDAQTGTAFAATDPRAGLDAEQAAAERLLRAVRGRTGVEPSVGTGEGKFIAWIAATVSAPGEVSVVPAGRERDFVAPLSPAFLPVSFEAQRKIALYGIRTLEELAALPAHAVEAQFGREGRRIHELARGIDPAPFVPRRRAETVSAALTMPAPTVNSGALIIAVRQLAGRLLRQPAMRHRQTRQLRLRLALLGGGSWERTLTLREPSGDEDALVFVLKKLIEPLQLAGPVEEVSLAFLGLTQETGKQRSLLFAEQARRRAQLMAALRQLRAQSGGEAQVSRVVEVEPWSRIPERRYALIDYDL
ncbi:MAG TPA: DNA polymerase Y family protein [Dehalococcoidia bacterium]|nr:DNA polymerase Y family protein [Dehalococcoidia bacterium]